MTRNAYGGDLGAGVVPEVRRMAVTVMTVMSAAGQAYAGPPYLSDDPEPTDTGHWEMNNISGETGFDINYGAAKGLQLTAVLPLAFGDARGFSIDGLRGGPGDVELAIKYRFLHQSENTWTPDLAFFPRLFVPTAGHEFGTGKFGLLLPIWAEKDFGPWSAFGGGGYQINPGEGQRDFWQGGVALSRSFGQRLSLGAEIYGQTRDAKVGGTYETVNFAATYTLVKHWSVLAAAGPQWNPGSEDGYDFYLALKADY
jgi:hypothetical protein